MRERYPQSGVFIYAMMAAGGDLGASVAPQLVGIIIDSAIGSEAIGSIAASLSLTAEQLGMKMGMLCGMLFPLMGIFVYLHMWRRRKREDSLLKASNE